jgi:hypothetical protein
MRADSSQGIREAGYRVRPETEHERGGATTNDRHASKDTAKPRVNRAALYPYLGEHIAP